MKITPTYLSVLLLFVSAAIISFLVYPKYISLSNLRAEALMKKREFEGLEKYYQQIREISEKLQNYQESLQKIDFAIPDSPSLPEFFNFLQKLSAASGLSLKNISSSPLAKEDKIQELKISLTLSGNYQDFKNFLSSLEKSARLIEINEISFSSSKEKEPMEFNLEIIIRSY
jgi:Tfp pilus assembly protein PilO